MKIVVLYDSKFGNTGIIAKTVARGAGKCSKAMVLPVTDAKKTDLNGVVLLFVGSPTHGGKPTPKLVDFINSIPDHIVKNIRFAAFDTRFLENRQTLPLKLLMKTIGYAAPKLSLVLRKKGAIEIVSSEGFIVSATDGPLDEGEVKRAESWAREVSNLYAKKNTTIGSK